jgi:hypothetical protein
MPNICHCNSYLRDPRIQITKRLGQKDRSFASYLGRPGFNFFLYLYCIYKAVSYLGYIASNNWMMVNNKLEIIWKEAAVA